MSTLKRLCVALELGVGFAQLISAPVGQNSLSIQSDHLVTFVDRALCSCWHLDDDINTALDYSVGIFFVHSSTPKCFSIANLQVCAVPKLF
jgi:hypothetical protein